MLPPNNQFSPPGGGPGIVSDQEFPPLGAPPAKAVEKKSEDTNTTAKKEPTNQWMVPSNVQSKAKK
jgi:hypothetical protein